MYRSIYWLKLGEKYSKARQLKARDGGAGAAALLGPDRRERRGGQSVQFNLGLDQRMSINVPIWMIFVGVLRWLKLSQFCLQNESILPVNRACHNSMHFYLRGPVEILLKWQVSESRSNTAKSA